MAYKFVSGGNLGTQTIIAVNNVDVAATTCHQSNIPSRVFPTKAGVGNKIYAAYQHLSGGNLALRGSIKLAGTTYRCKDPTAGYAKTLVADSLGTLFLFEVEGLTQITSEQMANFCTKIDFAIGQAPLATTRMQATVLAHGFFTNDVNLSSIGSGNPTTPSSTDMTLSGASWHGYQNYPTLCYGPVGLIAVPEDGSKPTVAWITHSFGDVAPDFRGAIATALIDPNTGPGALPHVLGMVNGSTLATASTDGRYKVLAQYCDAGWFDRIINDLGTLNTGNELTNIRTAMTAIQLHWKTNNGCRIYYNVPTPRTTDSSTPSSVQYTTEAGQTVLNATYGVGGARDAIIADIKAKNYGINGYFDWDSYVHGTDIRKWGLIPTTGATWSAGSRFGSDGTHQTQPGNDYISSVVNKYLVFSDDTTPPTVSSVAIESGGTSALVNFSEPIKTDSAILDGFTVTFGATTATTLMGKWISNQQLRLALSRVVKISDSPKLQFNSGTGSIADLAVPPNYMVGITNGAITNGSTETGGGGSGGAGSLVNGGLIR